LISAAVTRLELAFQYTAIALSLPLSLIIGVVLLLVNLGVPALSGIGVFFLILAIVSFPPKLMFDYRIKANVFTDKRVSLMREILQNMKMIKFYSWEDTYESLIRGIRNDEMTYIYKIRIVVAVFLGVMLACSGLVSMSAFIVQFGTYVMLNFLNVLFVSCHLGIMGYIARASKVLNMAAVSRFLYTPMSFLDSTPIEEFSTDSLKIPSRWIMKSVFRLRFLFIPLLKQSES
jgi:hypothetical protein